MTGMETYFLPKAKSPVGDRVVTLSMSGTTPRGVAETCEVNLTPQTSELSALGNESLSIWPQRSVSVIVEPSALSVSDEHGSLSREGGNH